MLDFLQTGALPAPAPMPKRRDLWLRVMRSGKLLTLPESAVHRLDARGHIVKSGLELCCAMPTGMEDRNQSTIVVKDVQPGEELRLYLRDTGQQVDVDLDQAEARDKPVTLRLVVVPPVGSTLPAAIVSPGGLAPSPAPIVPPIPAPRAPL